MHVTVLVAVRLIHASWLNSQVTAHHHAVHTQSSLGPVCDNFGIISETLGDPFGLNLLKLWITSIPLLDQFVITLKSLLRLRSDRFGTFLGQLWWDYFGTTLTFSYLKKDFTN